MRCAHPSQLWLWPCCWLLNTLRLHHAQDVTRPYGALLETGGCPLQGGKSLREQMGNENRASPSGWREDLAFEGTESDFSALSPLPSVPVQGTYWDGQGTSFLRRELVLAVIPEEMFTICQLTTQHQLGTQKAWCGLTALPPTPWVA